MPLTKLDGKILYYFRYDGTPVLDAEGNDTGTSNYTESTILMRNATYEKMVDSTISVKYDLSAQLALLYNYQHDPLAYSEEMHAYQAWRSYCKDACKKYFNNLKQEEK